ncbi:extracellular solute-binding protein [Paenibacillus sp. WQ 127069]|uniref:Extracellular solute-binding protein n=1 Tax=Paenibacillus baimaensis TaxID=2982185 RepID=A0ABT2USE4_9BACL|nr:extracellular solute-binding protein [Paenibacillus sp. WQ 127069]MCU6796599.1 extracellular solute-binding protein [Paenibacillus sp. WQ 127069]
MQHTKITYTILASIMGLGAILSGCGEDKEVIPAVSGISQGQASQFANKIKISMFNQGTFNAAAPLPPREEDIQRQMLENAMNIDLNMIIPQSGQATTKLNTLIAGGDIPDLLFLKSRADLAQYYDQGVLADLTPYLEQFPKLKQRFGKDSWDAMFYQGKTIAVPGYDNVNGISRSLFIRNDWLKKLNMKVPTTPDELFEVMRAFTEKDPDGNGKSDTFGFIGGMNKEGNLQTYGFDSLMWMFGVNPPSAIEVKDNKPVFLFIEPKMKEALAYINKMMEAKVVDPDWVTMNTPDLLDQKLYKGKVGFMVRDARRLEPDAQQKMKEIGGEVPEWIVIPPMKGPYGDEILERKSFQGNSWAISKKADKDKIIRILSLLEYLFTDKEAYPHFAYGIKGIHWDLVDGKVKNKTPDLTKELKEKYLWVDHYRMPRRGDDTEYFSFKNPKTAEAFTNNQKYVLDPLPGNLLTADLSDTLSADRTRFINESLVKFMTGKDPLSNWDQFLKTLDTKFDMQKYKDNAIKQFNDAGIIK